ncbi:LOG family protein [Leptolyngbya iicbica]|uniref:LOG family protein n=1 Tax=Leptolyngbya iicbica TaxID=3161580 RepID=UPI0005847574|nr:LOG family protein [Leptolyngbya sp. LK]
MSQFSSSDNLPRPASESVPVQNHEATFDIIQASVLGLWEVVNNLTRIRPTKRDRYRVTIFGSARMQSEDALYAGVRQLASELTLLGCDIITGGGPGLMQAANEGSVIADPEDLTRSIGIRVALEFEQAGNPFIEEMYSHRTFFSRLHHFVLISDAFVVVPGGIGTSLEALMIWQLLQVRKLHQTPLIFVGDMWADLVSWVDRYMIQRAPALADPADLSIPQCVTDCEAAIALLKASHAQWQQRSEP